MVGAIGKPSPELHRAMAGKVLVGAHVTPWLWRAIGEPSPEQRRAMVGEVLVGARDTHWLWCAIGIITSLEKISMAMLLVMTRMCAIVLGLGA
ncbi:hypothetical protein E2562_015368 [Oryza meyeriana var. granulata]|uniref:Uncharacterized protein n=1 Tax=Oryza meyeriana var. granulata TaxID=110450 RepID=A0A6G1EKY5_9ORYZ|nr:hypothetical protein E2562_015368 [Oryza meyeriana var. granulata]